MKELINLKGFNLPIRILRDYYYYHCCDHDPEEGLKVLKHISKLPVPEDDTDRITYFGSILDLIYILLYETNTSSDIEKAYSLSRFVFDKSKKDDPYFRKKAAVYIAEYLLEIENSHTNTCVKKPSHLLHTTIHYFFQRSF